MSFRGQLHEDYFTVDPNFHDDTIFYSIMMLIVLNYAPFLTQLILTPIVIIVPYIFVLKA